MRFEYLYLSDLSSLFIGFFTVGTMSAPASAAKPPKQMIGLRKYQVGALHIKMDSFFKLNLLGHENTKCT